MNYVSLSPSHSLSVTEFEGNQKNNASLLKGQKTEAKGDNLDAIGFPTACIICLLHHVKEPQDIQ